jgi:hypothetical protein
MEAAISGHFDSDSTGICAAAAAEGKFGETGVMCDNEGAGTCKPVVERDSKLVGTSS